MATADCPRKKRVANGRKSGEVGILHAHSRSDSRARRRRLCRRQTPPQVLRRDQRRWRVRPDARIRAAERKVIIVADRTEFESRDIQGHRGTPLCPTARCLVDTSKNPRAASLTGTAIFGRFVHGKRYILTDKNRGEERGRKLTSLHVGFRLPSCVVFPRFERTTANIMRVRDSSEGVVPRESFARARQETQLCVSVLVLDYHCAIRQTPERLSHSR